MKIKFWKEFGKTYKVAKKEYWIKLLSSVLIRGVLLVIPVLFSMAINLATKGEYEAAIIYIISSIILVTIYRILEGVNQKTLYDLYEKIYYYYNSLGVNKTNENSIFSLSRFNVGQYTNILTSDVDVITAFFSNLVMRTVQILEFLVIYAYFLSINIWIFVVAVAISLILVLIIPMQNKKVEEYNGNKKGELDKLAFSLHEYFKNIKDIKCFNIFDKIAPKTTEQTNKYLKANSKYYVKYTWNTQKSLLTIEIARLLSVGYGIYLVMQGRLEIDALLIIYNYYQKIIDNFGTILTLSVEYTNFKVSLERFNHLIEYSMPKRVVENAKEYITDGKIEFRNILYGYRNDPVLKNVSFEIEPNTLTVITGKDGNGKSGVFDLLLKLNRQHEGEILIDGTNINEISDEEYFSKISLLRQDTTLFAMTIEDNLLLVEPDLKKVVDVCSELGIHEEIMALKNRYNTVVGENDGIPLSLKKMIAIARIILKGSKIMLFDEALLGLTDSEQDKILDVLLKFKENHTIVIIAHDKNVVKNAERIIEINN